MVFTLARSVFAASLELEASSRLSSVAAARASATSGPVLQVIPLLLDFHVVTQGDSKTLPFEIWNTGGTELHVLSITSSSPEVVTDIVPPIVVPAGESVLGAATYTPGSAILDASLDFTSDSSLGAYRVLARGQMNLPPTFGSPVAIAVLAGQTVGFQLTAGDPDGDPLIFGADLLPDGASLNTETGAFVWVTDAGDRGTHAVDFWVFDGFVKVSATTEIVVENRPPVADPGGPYFGVAGEAIVLRGLGSYDPDGDALSYEWDFGDGAISTQASSVHVYAATGTYEVRLRVMDDVAGSSWVEASTSATVRGRPVSDPGGPYVGVANVPIQFDGSGSTDPDGDGLQYLWHFGDGTTADGMAPVHTYTAAGAYQVGLIVIDDSPAHLMGGAGTLALVSSASDAPVANPGGPYSGESGAPIQFDASASYDPNGDALSFQWQFGDGAYSADRSPWHTYEYGGTYSVLLRVDDEAPDPQTGWATTTATISGPLPPDDTVGGATAGGGGWWFPPPCPTDDGVYRVLIDASRDGGAWWSPLAGFWRESCLSHMGGDVATFLRSKGLRVDETWSTPVTEASLAGYDFVVRFNAASGYSAEEVDAYKSYVEQGGRLILISSARSAGENDELAEAFGISFRGACIGPTDVVQFTPHQLTEGLTRLGYTLGSGIVDAPPGAAFLAFLPSETFVDLDRSGSWSPGEPYGAPVMGLSQHGFGEILFIGSTGATLFPSQPLWENLARYFFVRRATVDFDPDVVNRASRAPSVRVYLEAIGYDVADVDPASVRLAGSVSPLDRSVVVGDRDQNGIPDMGLKFPRESLDPLLHVGNNTLRVTGTLVDGARFEGYCEVRVFDPPAPPLAVSVSPNPLNPSGTISFEVGAPAPARVDVFDVRGRLVRTLLRSPGLATGWHRITIDGGGKALSSGLYFYRVRVGAETVTGRFTILK